MQQNDRLYDIAVEDNNSSYSQAMWVLVCVLITVLAAIIAVWFGIKLTLISPMNRLIDSIRHIASGDLVKRIEVEGSNEIGQLAESLRHMQGELMNTGRNRSQHGTADGNREAERRKRASGQPSGAECVGNRAERRQSGGQRGANHA